VKFQNTIQPSFLVLFIIFHTIRNIHWEVTSMDFVLGLLRSRTNIISFLW